MYSNFLHKNILLRCTFQTNFFKAGVFLLCEILKVICSLHTPPPPAPAIPCSPEGDLGGGTGDSQLTMVAPKRVVPPSSGASRQSAVFL